MSPVQRWTKVLSAAPDLSDSDDHRPTRPKAQKAWSQESSLATGVGGLAGFAERLNATNGLPVSHTCFLSSEGEMVSFFLLFLLWPLEGLGMVFLLQFGRQDSLFQIILKKIFHTFLQFFGEHMVSR